MIDSLQQVLEDQVSEHAPLSEWIETAKNERLWKDIVDQWHEIACEDSLNFPVEEDLDLDE